LQCERGLTMTTPVLFQFTNSHFNEKARWALDFKRVPHIRRSLVPGRHLRPILKVTGKTTVPVLVIDGEVIADSTRIIEELERRHPEPALYPSDPAERARALELEEFFDEELGPYIRRWLFHVVLPYPGYMVGSFAGHVSAAERIMMRAAFPLIRVMMKRAMNIYPEPAAIARTKTIAAMDRLVGERQPSGYLVGERFSVADLTAAAL